MKIYDNFDEFISVNSSKRIYLVTKYGNTRYDHIKYEIGDSFMFGSESTGITDEVYKKLGAEIIESAEEVYSSSDLIL